MASKILVNKFTREEDTSFIHYSCNFYLSQGCGLRWQPRLLCCGQGQIWTSCFFLCLSLCQSRWETALTGLRSHTQWGKTNGRGDSCWSENDERLIHDMPSFYPVEWARVLPTTCALFSGQTAANTDSCMICSVISESIYQTHYHQFASIAYAKPFFETTGV